MAVPQVYRKQDEKAIASFDFEDVVTGLGTVIFYGIDGETSGGRTYHLTTNKDAWAVLIGTTQGTSGQTTTINFDSAKFNLPRTAKGTATISCGMGAANSDVVKLQIQLFHVDAADQATSITSEITSQSYTGVAANNAEMVFLELPITQKIFKKDESLRLVVKLVYVSGSTTQVVLGHDPQNRTYEQIIPATADSTVMRLFMTFRTDL